MTLKEIEKLINPPLVMTPEIQEEGEAEKAHAMECLRTGKPYVPLWFKSKE